jgi:hypothetical protein
MFDYAFVDVKPCSSNPCLNSGICYNNGNDFVCVCSSSWTGARCEIFQNVIVPTTPSTGKFIIYRNEYQKEDHICLFDCS